MSVTQPIVTRTFDQLDVVGAQPPPFQEGGLGRDADRPAKSRLGRGNGGQGQHRTQAARTTASASTPGRRGRHTRPPPAEAPGGRATVIPLGKETGWEKSRLSRHLSRMEQRGPLRHRKCPEAGRYSDIALTEAGRSAIETAAPSHVAHVSKWFIEAMTPEQLTAFGAICEAVTARSNALGVDPCRIGRQTGAEPSGSEQ